MSPRPHTPPPASAADLVIAAGWVVPVIPRGAVWRDCAVVIAGERIRELLPRTEAIRKYPDAKFLHLPDSLLMPGLVNAHNHAAMALFRGLADDLPLNLWLEAHIWPAEARWVSPDFVADGTRLAIAEMFATGTTCFADMYFFPDVVATVARQARIRAQIAFPILEFATPWARTADECLHKGLAVYDEHHGDPMLRIAFGPHAPYSVADATFERIATYAAELEASVHIHLHETAREVADALAAHGERPIARLHRFGLLARTTQCVHMTQVDASDCELLVATGASVIHCPESNLKLASGFCPVSRLRGAGIPVALGTDGPASNNDLDLFGEMQTAALLGKAVSGDAASLAAAEMIEMATLGGAAVLGLDDEIGSLEAGKAADLIALEFTDPGALPLYNPLSQLVYTGCGRRVSHVWVAGQCVLEGREFRTIDLPALRAHTHEWRERIAGNLG